MKELALVLLLCGGLIGACGDDRSSRQQEQTGMTEPNSMMAADSPMMSGDPLMRMTPTMAR